MRTSRPIRAITDNQGVPIFIPCYRIVKETGPEFWFKIIDIRRWFDLLSVSDTKITSIVGEQNIKTIQPRVFGEVGKPCRYVNTRSLFRILIYYAASDRKCDILNNYLDHVYENLNGGFLISEESPVISEQAFVTENQTCITQN